MTVARRRLDRPRPPPPQRRGRGGGRSRSSPRGSPPRPSPASPTSGSALLFACAHPALDPGVRAPLMLQVVLGLDARRIASAFLVSPAAMAKRLVRAKAQDPRGRHPLRRPRARRARPAPRRRARGDLRRLRRGLDRPAGTDAARRELTGEAIFLARLVAGLLPDEPEALGLLALMLHAEARRPARRDAAGDYVPLGWQDPARWDAAMIDEAEALLRRASTLGAIGRFQLEAALQSAHVAPLPQRPCRLAAGGRALRRAARALRLAGRRDQPRARRRRAATARPPASPRSTRSPPIRASPSTSRSGRPAPSSWPGPAPPREARHAYALAIGLERDPAVRRFLQQARGALPDR